MDLRRIWAQGRNRGEARFDLRRRRNDRARQFQRVLDDIMKLDLHPLRGIAAAEREDALHQIARLFRSEEDDIEGLAQLRIEVGLARRHLAERHDRQRILSRSWVVNRRAGAATATQNPEQASRKAKKRPALLRAGREKRWLDGTDGSPA